jgi:hypothetical protein
MGIELGGNGVELNDPGDADNGANDLQNFPNITSAPITGTDLTIIGTLNSKASMTYQIDFYASSTTDGSGHGEAERYLGSTGATTNAGGIATINHLLSGAGVTAGEFITATATAPDGSTSEFALNVTPVVTNSPPTDITPNSFSLNENIDTTGGYSLGVLTATDPDGGESLRTVQETTSRTGANA